MVNSKYIIIFFIFLFSCNCKTCVISNSCPDIKIYTLEEQTEIDKIITKNNNIVLNKVLIDYFNLREKIKECKK